MQRKFTGYKDFLSLHLILVLFCFNVLGFFHLFLWRYSEFSLKGLCKSIQDVAVGIKLKWCDVFQLLELLLMRYKGYKLFILGRGWLNCFSNLYLSQTVAVWALRWAPAVNSTTCSFFRAELYPSTVLWLTLYYISVLQ